MMDHHLIDAESTVELYVTGRLTEEEAIRFEEHYLDCSQCIANVEAAERLHRGLSKAIGDVEEETSPAETSAPLRPFRPPTARSSFWLPSAAAAAVLLCLGAALFFSRQARQLRQELDGAQVQLARYETEAAQGSSKQPDSELARRLESWKQPAANLPLALLTPLRGGEEVFPVALPQQGLWTTLWLELGGDELPSYQATLLSPDGKAAWRGTGLRLNSLGALLILLPADLLSPGPWELVVEGQREADSEPHLLATFSLAVQESSLEPAKTEVPGP